MTRISRLALLVLALVSGDAIGQADDARLVVLGFDGADFGRIQLMMKTGEMPNMARLAREGSLGSLATTDPAQSPVSWASMTTGLSPARTGIDGFLRRDFSDGTVSVDYALVGTERNEAGLSTRAARRPWGIALAVAGFFIAAFAWRRRRFLIVGIGVVLFAGGAIFLHVSERELPDGHPVPVNLRSGEAWWERLDAAGVSTTTLAAPCSFPAPELDHGRLICGLGVPDALGGPGQWTLLSDDAAQRVYTETGGLIMPLVLQDPDAGEGPFEPVIIDGPLNVVADDGSRTGIGLLVSFDKEGRSVALSTAVGRQIVSQGRWSEPFPFLFKMSDWVRVRAFSRFKVLEADEKVRIYLDPLSFDPAELPPGIRLANPDDYAAEVAGRIGPFETVGWACATNALKDGKIDERTFLEDAIRVWDEQERMAIDALESRDERVLTCIFTATDRIQHMFKRYEAHKAPAGDELFTSAINEAYKRMDRFVGRVLEQRRDGDQVLVVSDHGFAPWRKSVNLNAMLLEKGLLVLKDPSSTARPRSLGEDLGSPLDHVDWSRTKAYALGLGKVYLNRVGREPQGIVADEDASAVLAAIETALGELRDMDVTVVSSIARGATLYPDAFAIPNGAADLYVGFKRGYRISWQSCLVGISEPVLSANTNAWSGDHCSVDPKLVPGVVASTLTLKTDGAGVADIAATVLAWCGVGADDLDGRSLLQP